MIQIHTDLPPFPDIRTRLLYSFLSSESGAAQSELLSLATSLMQLGTDTHDLVSNDKEENGQVALRSKQLKVLAGDYFSARFYHILAQSGQIGMIKALAQNICEVNRQKMSLYLTMKTLKLTAEEYIQRSVQIRSQLYLSFTGLLKGKASSLWPEIVQAFVKGEFLLQELFRTQAAGDFKESWGFWHVLQNGAKEDRKLLQSQELEPGRIRTILMKYHIPGQLYQLLDDHIKGLAAKVKQLEPDRLAGELAALYEPFTHYLSSLKVQEEI